MLRSLFKHFFQKEEIIPLEEVAVDSLDGWLAGKFSSSSFQESILSFLNRVREQLRLLQDKIAALRSAALAAEEAERIAPRVQHIVHGHKESYLRSMTQFVDHIPVFPDPENCTLVAAWKFVQQLQGQLDDLAQRTAHSYRAAQHLFFQPVEDIFLHVGELSRLVKDFDQQLAEQQVAKILELQGQLALLKECREKNRQMQQDLQQKKARQALYNQERSDQEQQIAAWQQTPEQEQFRSLQEKRLAVRRLVQNIDQDISAFFSKVSRVLRKYHRLVQGDKQKSSLIAGYVEDPVSSLSADPDLQVVLVLENMAACMQSGRLPVDEKERALVVELVGRGKGNELQQLREKKQGFLQQLQDIEEQLRCSPVEQLIAEAVYKRDHFTEQLALLEEEMERLRRKLDISEEPFLREEIRKLSAEAFHVRLLITS